MDKKYLIILNRDSYIIKLFIISFICLLSCKKSNLSNNNSENIKNEPQIKTNSISNDDCVDFVALWPAKDIAKKIGKNKKWVFLNYTVEMWDIPPSKNLGNVIGKLRASSYAKIIDRTDNEFLVESPMTKVHGWIDKSHVKSISRKNVTTKKLCN